MYVIGRNDYGQLFTGNTTRAYYATEVEKKRYTNNGTNRRTNRINGRRRRKMYIQ